MVATPQDRRLRSVARSLAFSGPSSSSTPGGWGWGRSSWGNSEDPWAAPASSRSETEFPVWPGVAPGSEGRANEEVVINERVQKTHQPTLTAHLPPAELATGAAVIVAPGGGYHHLAINKEGHQVAQWLATLGIAAFVLKYRLGPDDGRDEAAQSESLADALQSLRLLRERAEEWGVDPAKLGLMGFSAGAHLAINVVLNAATPAERPDFIAPIYCSTHGLDISYANNLLFDGAFGSLGGFRGC